MTAKRSVFSEQTLVPVSLVITFLGLAAWIGNVSARADDGQRTQDKIMAHLDLVIAAQSDMRAQVSSLDAKVDMLLHRAALQREADISRSMKGRRP